MRNGPKQINDRQLIDRCVSGDRFAAEEFVQAFSDLIYGSIQQTLKSRGIPAMPQDLEDLHHTVFLKLFDKRCRKLDQFRGKNGCSLKTWVRIVTVRIVLNRLREKKIGGLGIRRFNLSLDQIPELGAQTESGLQHLEKKERLQLIRQGVKRLSDRERQVFRLGLVQGMPADEIAANMKLSIQNVYTIRHRAIKKLKHYIGNEQQFL